MRRTFQLLAAFALMSFAATGAWGQPPDDAGSRVGDTIRDAARGAVQGALRESQGPGPAVGDRAVGDTVRDAVRGAVRGVAGDQRPFQVDGRPPRFGDDIRTTADLENQFRRYFGPHVDRDRFRYSDNHWWYRTREGDWIYERDGRWYGRDGRPYTGFDAYNAGYRHPNYRYHDGHWWYYTGNDWVFYRNGNWYYGDGRFFAPRRPGFSFAAGPVRLNIFMGNDGRRYRYHDDHWWYRDNGSWFYLRDGWWYHESGRRDHDAESGIREQLRFRYEATQRVRQQRTAEADPRIAGDIETAAAPWPAPPAPEAREDDQPVAALEAELPEAPQAPPLKTQRPLTTERDDGSRIEVGDEIPSEAELETAPGRTAAPREPATEADAEGEHAETAETKNAEGDAPVEPVDVEPADEGQPVVDEDEPAKEGDADDGGRGNRASRVEQPTPGEANSESGSDNAAPQKPEETR